MFTLKYVSFCQEASSVNTLYNLIDLKESNRWSPRVASRSILVILKIKIKPFNCHRKEILMTIWSQNFQKAHLQETEISRSQASQSDNHVCWFQRKGSWAEPADKKIIIQDVHKALMIPTTKQLVHLKESDNEHEQINKNNVVPTSESLSKDLSS